MQAAGIDYISDIVNMANGKFINYCELIETYGDVGSFIDYHAIVSCIPQEWKDILTGKMEGQTRLTQVGGEKIEQICKYAKVSAGVYNDYILSKSSIDGAQISWNIELNMDYSVNDW